MRIVRVAAVLLAAAFGASAVAFAVERPAKREDDEATEQTASVTGVLAADGKGYRLAGRELGLGPPWWRESGKAADFDGDGTVETVTAELKSLTDKRVIVTGEVDDEGELGVRTIAGKAFREGGRPPWAGGPKRDDKTPCKSGKREAKGKRTGAQHGPPPWAKAHGVRCR
jgi:hypothetical protein